MNNWLDCVVSYFDLIGIRKMITARNSRASNLMRLFHTLVYNRINTHMPAHYNAYVWNDSAMFLSFPQNDGDYEIVMRELNVLKPIVDSICPSYAICIKGQAIPEPACGYGTKTNGQPRFVFLKASSDAFANCFEVEKELCKKKKLKMDWYIDSRIARKIPAFAKCDRHDVAMLPSGRKRNVYVLKGSIWKQP
ncbi:MAG TPA: hypothetical protein VMW42_00980 [Desulfatiglandales bacterium]|nr:hypothetical protein [Desulfatiglandales bacterium]